MVVNEEKQMAICCKDQKAAESDQNIKIGWRILRDHELYIFNSENEMPPYKYVKVHIKIDTMLERVAYFIEAIMIF